MVLIVGAKATIHGEGTLNTSNSVYSSRTICNFVCLVATPQSYSFIRHVQSFRTVKANIEGTTPTTKQCEKPSKTGISLFSAQNGDGKSSC